MKLNKNLILIGMMTSEKTTIVRLLTKKPKKLASEIIESTKIECTKKYINYIHFHYLPSVALDSYTIK